MRWRYVKAVLLGALLGFAGQFLTDFFCWVAPDGAATPQHQFYVNGEIWWDRSFPPQLRSQAQQLCCQFYFLYWLRHRGEVALRIAAVAALLGVSSVMAADQLRERRKARKEVSA